MGGVAVIVGPAVGIGVGNGVGVNVGRRDGAADGRDVGVAVGKGDGTALGVDVGAAMGNGDGNAVGTELGITLIVGSGDGALAIDPPDKQKKSADGAVPWKLVPVNASNPHEISESAAPPPTMSHAHPSGMQ